ncbi:hypothetical protein THAOC_14417, partial [Thalassiosira oceanica]
DPTSAKLRGSMHRNKKRAGSLEGRLLARYSVSMTVKPGTEGQRVSVSMLLDQAKDWPMDFHQPLLDVPGGSVTGLRSASRPGTYPTEALRTNVIKEIADLALGDLCRAPAYQLSKPGSPGSGTDAFHTHEVAGLAEAARHRGRREATGLRVEALTHLATGTPRCNGMLYEDTAVELMARNFFTREIAPIALDHGEATFAKVLATKADTIVGILEYVFSRENPLELPAGDAVTIIIDGNLPVKAANIAANRA